MRIGLISDTHSYMEEDILQHLEECDEIWHAGDIGDISVIDKLPKDKPFRAVYGNIDHGDVRTDYPLDLDFKINNVRFFITHIGGYPGRYTKRVYGLLKKNQPDVYICGHSHICKVMYDKSMSTLHINPGACGIHGFHSVRTMIRFTVGEDKLEDVQVIELGARGGLKPKKDKSVKES